MRSLIIAGTLLVLGTAAASAQPWYGRGYGPPPPPPGYGWGGPPPVGFYGAPPRRCWWRDTFWGPRRVCRGGW